MIERQLQEAPGTLERSTRAATAAASSLHHDVYRTLTPSRDGSSTGIAATPNALDFSANDIYGGHQTPNRHSQSDTRSGQAPGVNSWSGAVSDRKGGGAGTAEQNPRLALPAQTRDTQPAPPAQTRDTQPAPPAQTRDTQPAPPAQTRDTQPAPPAQTRDTQPAPPAQTRDTQPAPPAQTRDTQPAPPAQTRDTQPHNRHHAAPNQHEHHPGNPASAD